MPMRPREDIEQWPGPERIPFYYSRPDLRPPRLNIIHRDPKRATPGYVFVSPEFSGEYRPDSGPYIFDNINGTLIWSGISAAGGAGQANVQGLHLCHYHDSPHLCFWRGQRRDGHGSGVGVIMAQNYTIVKTISSTASSPGGVDLHEFRLTPENTALITTSQPRFVDGLWILDSCFEEVPLDSEVGGQAPFHWCASDHINLDESPRRKYLSSTHMGRTPDRAWDYVRLNSVDKSPMGDYLISARNLDCVMLVSGVDGSIRWRLGGGKMSNFTLDGDAHFARQHDARFVSGSKLSNGTLARTTTISLFNNRNDGINLRHHPSGGFILELDLDTATARRVSEYSRITASKPAAGGSGSSGGKGQKEYITANGMGNLQTLLPNGHVLTNFGQHGALAEYHPEGGDPMFYADFLPPAPGPHSSSSSSLSPSMRWKANNYRAYLYPFGPLRHNEWLGQPTTTPDLWTYARTPTARQTFYVSWNGDTRTKQYRFWVSDVDPCTTSTSTSTSTSSHTSSSSTPSTTTPRPGSCNDRSLAPADDTFGKAGAVSRDTASFETNFTIYGDGGAHAWSFAEALDQDGLTIARSSKVRTYIPAAGKGREACGEYHCFPSGLRDEDLIPLDEFSRAVLGLSDGKEGGWGSSRGFLFMEHLFALVGLGLCAWWVLSRICTGWRDSKGGYEPVAEMYEGQMYVRGPYSGVEQHRMQRI